MHFGNDRVIEYGDIRNVLDYVITTDDTNYLGAYYQSVKILKTEYNRHQRNMRQNYSDECIKLMLRTTGNKQFNGIVAQSIIEGSSKYFLGDLCKHGHEFIESGQSLRYTHMKFKDCVACKKLRYLDKQQKIKDRPYAVSLIFDFINNVDWSKFDHV